ncbi:MAG: hypothetical protein G01um101448_1228 [Parcubacteria group bacterium Gr01-1014_48]|nr:MAG: hypothetical protein G01um101448_1228 [Parcubacteria group bacterium Gr01-1014_48]
MADKNLQKKFSSLGIVIVIVLAIWALSSFFHQRTAAETFLLMDSDGNIFESDLNGVKTKITKLPFEPPISGLFISEDRNISLWTHSPIVGQDGTGFDIPGPGEAYVYERSKNIWRKFDALEPSWYDFKDLPLKLSPNGKFLAVAERGTSLSMIDTETGAKQALLADYGRKGGILGGIVRQITFWRWLNDSTNFYYTNTESILVERQTSDWQSHSILYKFNINEKKAALVFDAKSLCQDSDIIPQSHNEKMLIVICYLDNYNNIKIYAHDISAQKSEVVFEGSYGGGFAGATINSITPDGRRFVYYEGFIYVYDLSTRERKKIDLKINRNKALYFSRDGSKLLYRGQDIPTQIPSIFVYDFATGQIKQIFEDDKLSILGF